LLHIRHDRTADSADLIIGENDVLGYAHLDVPADPAEGFSGELVVHPQARYRGYGRALLDAMTSRARGELRVWAHGDMPAAAVLARSAGFLRVRALWQMRRSLAEPVPEPVLPAGVTLRTFVPGKDEAAWLEVNRRAFAHHPEQGAWTSHDLAMREQEAWFDPDGLFLAVSALPGWDGRLLGFHWTKIHSRAMGEVYVVGVDPAAQGGGLGRALTLVGVRYLQERGLGEVMLYVDEDNKAAVRMYSALGFARLSTDVMYAPAPTPAGELIRRVRRPRE
jgi:mycothiol synthase